MPLSVQQLSQTMTEDEVLQFLRDSLASIGFVTTSWVEGSTRLNILRAVARTYSQATGSVKQILEYILTHPAGDWLDLIGLYWYKLARLEAVYAIRDVTLVSAPSAPPHSILAGSYLGTLAGVRFTVNTTAPLASGATITVAVTAELAGIGGNVPASTPVFTQVPAYSGVTAAFDGAPTTNGVNRESDDRYLTRLDRRLSELTYSVGLRAYELWALTAAPSVERVKALNNYPTENEVRIVLYPGEASEIAQVEAYIAGRHPPNDITNVTAAAIVGQSIVATPRVYAGTTEAALISSANQIINAMPIGGWHISGAVAGRFLRERVTEAWLCRNGVQSSGLITPPADVILGATDVVIPSYSLTLEKAI